jgi:hypothetical protein
MTKHSAYVLVEDETGHSGWIENKEINRIIEPDSPR